MPDGIFIKGIIQWSSIEYGLHIYSSAKGIIIGSHYGLSPGYRQAIAQTNPGLLSIGSQTNPREILIVL